MITTAAETDLPPFTEQELEIHDHMAVLFPSSHATLLRRLIAEVRRWRGRSTPRTEYLLQYRTEPRGKWYDAPQRYRSAESAKRHLARALKGRAPLLGGRVVVRTIRDEVVE